MRKLKNGDLVAVFSLLFIISVVSSITRILRGRGRRRRARILPLALSLIGLGRRTYFDEDDVYPDLFDTAQIDEELGLTEMEALRPRDDDALHPPLRPSKDDIRDPPEALAVEKVDRFLSFEFAIARFHILLYAVSCRNVQELHEISRFRLPSAFFSRRETCACEMPTSAEISVWVFPSK